MMNISYDIHGKIYHQMERILTEQLQEQQPFKWQGPCGTLLFGIRTSIRTNISSPILITIRTRLENDK